MGRAVGASGDAKTPELRREYEATSFSSLDSISPTPTLFHSNMAAAMESHIKLAKSLDPRLLRFFKRFPPPEIAAARSPPPSLAETIQIASNTSSSDPNEAAPTTTETVGSESSPSDPRATTNSDGKKRNPFLAFKNPKTGHWHAPHYSLRRQAVLFKLAKEQGVLSLMPLCPKHPEVKEQKRIEQGLRVRGTGEGGRVKGHVWERTLRSRLEERRKAMEGMPEMIRQWKQRGHGRGWKKWPGRG